MLDEPVADATKVAGVRPRGPWPRHPNEIDWEGQGRSWPGLKHAYAILWRRHVLAGDRSPVRSSRTMALVLHCSLTTAWERTTRLEAMGLLSIVRGSAVVNGDEVDEANEYWLAMCQGEQHLVSAHPRKQYTGVDVPTGGPTSLEEVEVLFDLAPPPEQDRWRHERLGPVAWLLAADLLAEAPFTVRDMVERLGLSRKAVTNALTGLAAAGLGQQVPGHRWVLQMPVEVDRGVRDECAEWLAQEDRAEFYRRTTDEDRELTVRDEKVFLAARRQREDYAVFTQLTMLNEMAGKRLDGSPLLPSWTEAYNLTWQGWTIGTPSLSNESGWPLQDERVALSETFTHRPRPTPGGVPAGTGATPLSQTLALPSAGVGGGCKAETGGGQSDGRRNLVHALAGGAS